MKCYSTFRLNLREVSWSCQWEVIYVGDTFPLLIFQTLLMSYIWDHQMFCHKGWSTFYKTSKEKFWRICSTHSKVTFVLVHFSLKKRYYLSEARMKYVRHMVSFALYCFSDRMLCLSEFGPVSLWNCTYHLRREKAVNRVISQPCD